MNLKNKIVVVTGASDGIGKQIALKLAEQNTKLVLIGRDAIRLGSVAESCLKLGSPKCEFYQVDLRNSGELKTTTEKIASDFGGVDILINCAGVWAKVGGLEQLSEESIDENIDTNLRAVVKLTHFMLPHLKDSKEAAIVNVSSRSGYLAQAGQSVYSATKWGVTGFSEVLKVDLKGTNVRVATIHQGGTDTKIFEKAGDGRDTTKFTNPSDLAEVVVYMLSRPSKIWLHDVRVEY